MAQARSLDDMAEVSKETCWDPTAVWWYWGTKGAGGWQGEEKWALPHCHALEL